MGRVVALIVVAAACSSSSSDRPVASSPPVPSEPADQAGASAETRPPAAPVKTEGQAAWRRAGDVELPDQELRHAGIVLRIGDRVRLTQRDRVLQPDETGHPRPLAFGPNQTGVVVGFLRREAAGAVFPVALIRWDAQKWAEWDIPLNRMEDGKVYTGEDMNKMNEVGEPTVPLPAFEMPTHPELLDVL